MMNKNVQQKLCTELKTTIQENIEFAIAYEEGTIRQKSFDQLGKLNVKTEAGEMNNVNQSVTKSVTHQEMLQMRGSFYNTTSKRMKGDGNNLHEMWKEGQFCEVVPN